jgi:8-oxo-dGTP pyrophosphatase MutT (NUDIX family)
MLDFDPSREGVPPKHAATLVVVREAAPAPGLEVFCVERQRVGFLGGAIVFPGGKLDPADLEPAWASCTNAPRPTRTAWAEDEAACRALAIAACREALEEAAILPVVGDALDHALLLDWRARVARKETTLRELLTVAGRTLDLASLLPFARWITPVAESRRYDTRFFLFVADRALTGAHDDHETTASFWERPEEVLRRFVAGELQLAPPTHRTLEVLAGMAGPREAAALADAACLEPICPRLVSRDGAVALVLPGDPEHEVRTPRCPGKSRYVLRGDRFLPEDAPAEPAG